LPFLPCPSLRRCDVRTGVGDSTSVVEHAERRGIAASKMLLTPPVGTRCPDEYRRRERKLPNMQNTRRNRDRRSAQKLAPADKQESTDLRRARVPEVPNATKESRPGAPGHVYGFRGEQWKCQGGWNETASGMLHLAESSHNFWTTCIHSQLVSRRAYRGGATRRHAAAQDCSLYLCGALPPQDYCLSPVCAILCAPRGPSGGRAATVYGHVLDRWATPRGRLRLRESCLVTSRCARSHRGQATAATREDTRTISDRPPSVPCACKISGRLARARGIRELLPPRC
jgi:hypothetical protein